MAKFKVIGTLPVGDVEPGGVVDLDPRVVNTPALVRAGFLQQLRVPATSTPRKARKPKKES